MPVRIAPWCFIFRAVVVRKIGSSTQVTRLYGRGGGAKIDVLTTVAPVTALSRIPTRPGAHAGLFVAEREADYSLARLSQNPRKSGFTGPKADQVLTKSPATSLRCG